MRIKLKVICFLLFFTMILPQGEADAYKFSGQKISYPNDAMYWIQGANSNLNFTNSLREEIRQGIKAWNSAPKININTEVTLLGAQVKIQYTDSYNGSIYGSYSPSTKFVTLFKKWRLDLNKTRRIETVIHEVGHVLGLDHTQTANDSISVMRQYNFNDKTYILDDDFLAIHALY